MNFTPLALPGSFLISLQPLADERGWFARTFCKNEFATIGHHEEFVQMNHSFTNEKGTIRGMHFQHPPHSEIKLVRCIAGAVFDVIVDIRTDSTTFLQWTGVELSAANRNLIYIPKGFAHGFQTLTDNAELIYHHTAFYAPGVEGGIRFDDGRIGIEWPLDVTMVSQRDQQYPYLTSSFAGVKL